MLGFFGGPGYERTKSFHRREDLNHPRAMPDVKTTTSNIPGRRSVTHNTEQPFQLSPGIQCFPPNSLCVRFGRWVRHITVTISHSDPEGHRFVKRLAAIDSPSTGVAYWKHFIRLFRKLDNLKNLAPGNDIQPLIWSNLVNCKKKKVCFCEDRLLWFFVSCVHSF